MLPQAASGVRRAMMVAAVIILFAMRIGYVGFFGRPTVL